MDFINRELSWLEFNERVLEEAQDKSNLLLERLKFLAITESNLDEFYMVRVSGLLEQVWAKHETPDISGLTPSQQLKLISKKAHEMTLKQYNCLNRSILPGLEKEGLFFVKPSELSLEAELYVKRYFNSTVYPILTPMAIDQSRRVSLLNNKSIYLIIEIDKGGETHYAVMQIPTVIPRIIKLPYNGQRHEFILLDDLIKENSEKLFPGHSIKNQALFRITRNSDLEFDEEDTEDLLVEIEKSIKSRKWGEPVRLQAERSMAKNSRKFLKKIFNLDEGDVFEIPGIMDLNVWMGFYFSTNTQAFEHLKNRPLPPQPAPAFMNKSVFDAIKESDILVHHPYESFDCVVNFVKEAASDPDVLAIKQTLYRVSGDSPIIKALMLATENGKQVTVLVELKARFDEENNINWAKKLEKAGCHVVYGLVGLKTHCKLCLVVRKEEDGIRRYIHLGTGNYNDSTAKIYTDLGYFTCKESFGQDVSSLFNVLTGYSSNNNWNKLAVAPFNLRQNFLRFIHNEAQNARNGKPAGIVAKLNSLVDEEIIRALYSASQAGVPIRLIVRGICCLKTGTEYSENIVVMSIVDRFLEHSRIYYFENAGNPKIFLSSADWMPRNLDRRVEVSFPIDEPALVARIANILHCTQNDTVKLRLLQPDGSYEKVDRRGKESIQSQLMFYQEACLQASRNEGKEFPL